MTEREKLLRSDVYNARDPELLEMYYEARRLLQEYSQLIAADLEKKDQVLANLLGFKGQSVWIEAPFFCNYGKHISIGDYTFVNVNCMFLDDNRITIGHHCLIAPYVQIYTASHPLLASERIISPHPDTHVATYRTMAFPVTIGDRVWIGGNTVIMPGITIGNNVTIGAGSVVTRDVPDNVLAFGNPCKVIREL